MLDAAFNTKLGDFRLVEHDRGSLTIILTGTMYDHWQLHHIRMGAIAFIRSLWLCRNDKVFDNKNFSILLVYLPVYQYTLFMVISTADGGSRPVYGGLCRTKDYSEGYFFPT
jgi:hypothetical protein